MDKLLEHYGTQYKIAKALGVSRAYVCQWFKAGSVPALMAITIEVDTAGELKAVELVGLANNNI